MSLAWNHLVGDATTIAKRQRYHLTWLIVSLAVLALASVCSVRGEAMAFAGMATPLPETCLSRRLLNFDCPGCGLTRSFVALAHFDVARAWHFNPAGLLWFAALLWQAPYRAAQLYLLRGGRELTVRRGVSEGLLLVLIAACLAQWMVRGGGEW
jgi:hypothetical protein